MGHNYWKPVCPKACALRWKKPPQWDAHTPQKIAPATRESPRGATKTLAAKKKERKKYLKPVT